MMGRSGGIGTGLVALALLAAPVDAQDRDRLRDRCADAGMSTDACQEGALAVEALLGGVGLSLSGGSQLPGSPSTLGRRFGSSPRWAFAAQVGIAQFDLPQLDPADPSAPGDVWVPALQGEVAAGVFDGFQLAPTVGGFLSVDLLATGSVAFLPGGDGFDGAAPAWGYGARVGLLRESFSLPALTLSLARRHVSGFEYGDPGQPGVEVDGLTVTSVRATLGKEFMALGILAGMGWERASGDGWMRPPAAGAQAVAFDGTDARRLVLFGGLTRTWLVLQASAQAGFATGYDERPGGEGDGSIYDPSGGSFFGSLAFRLIY